MVELSDNRGFFDKSNKWGFIDKNGKVVIPLKYSGLYDFREGLARVVLNDKYGYIERDGTEYFED